MKRLIAADFDGTFNIRGEIPPVNRAGVEAWRAAGGYFGFVTGRGVDFIGTVRELEIPTDYLLLYNGALLTDADGTVMKEYRIPSPVFADLVRFFAAIPDALYYSKAGEETAFRHYYASFADETRALEVASLVNARFGDEVTAFVNGVHVNVGKKGSGKTQGVLDALAHFGLGADEAAVFGDDYNDLDMIVSLNGWAVSTARGAVLQAAPHVCESVGKAALALLGEHSFEF
ncbi:MAG: HAD hydrolase family protein [Clostridia bacterium]|nr:HAD hydrolase family protein [Clostridia bacterium]